MDEDIKESEDEKMSSLIRKVHRFPNSKKDGGKNFKRMEDELSKMEKREHSKKNLITCCECKKTQTH